MVEKEVMIIGALVVLILVGVAVFTVVTSPPQATTSVTQQQTVATTLPTTTVSQAVLVVPPTPANASIAKLFITANQLNQMLGSTTRYGAYQRTTKNQLQYALPIAFQPYNITAEYNMTYNATISPANGNVLAEVIFPSNAAKPFYSYVLASYPFFNATLLRLQGANVLSESVNSTLPGGFTYSSSIFSVNALALNQTGSRTMVFQVMAARTNNTVVLLSLLQLNGTKGLNATTLAQETFQNLG